MMFRINKDLGFRVKHGIREKQKHYLTSDIQDVQDKNKNSLAIMAILTIKTRNWELGKRVIL